MDQSSAKGIDGRGRSRGGGAAGRRGSRQNRGSSGGGGGGGAGRKSLKETKAMRTSMAHRNNQRGESHSQLHPTAPGISSSQLNAAVPEFRPAASRVQNFLPLVRTYASVLSNAPESGDQSTLSRPRSAQTTSIIANTDEILDVLPSNTQINASGSLPGAEPQRDPSRSLPEDITPVTKPKEAELEEAAASDSHPIQVRSIIGEAYLTAPYPTSFLGAIAQAEAIRNAHARPAPELTNIGPNYHPEPNRASFEALWANRRVRSDAFPTIQTVLSNAATDCAPASNPVPLTAVAPSAPLPVPVVATAITTSEPVSLTSTVVSLPPAGVLILPTPPPLLTCQIQVLPDNQNRDRLHRQVQSLSQSETSLLSGSRSTIRRLSFTPTKTPLRNAQPYIPASPLDLPGDTPEQKEKIRKVMSSFTEVGGSFDSIVWGKNQGHANRGESPEILAVPAQPVASYTTVGSLRPATTQQFTAPNRIQRDGTGRRPPPQANVQGRGQDNQFSARTMNQQYNSGYGSSSHSQYGGVSYPQYGPTIQQQSSTSMQQSYGPMAQPGSSVQSSHGSIVQSQHHPASRSRFGISPTYEPPSASPYDTNMQSRFGSFAQDRQENQSFNGSSSLPGFGSNNSLQNHNNSSSIGLTNEEKKAIHVNGPTLPTADSVAPSTRSGNMPRQNRDTILRNDPSSNHQTDLFSVQRQNRGHRSDQANFTQNTLPEAENEHNYNPRNYSMQQFARDTFSESSAAHPHRTAMSRGSLLSQQSMTGNTSHGQAGNVNTYSSTGYDSQSRGDLDQNYRFPSGLTQPAPGSRSGTGYSQLNVSRFGSNEQVTASQRFFNRPGRPQPLTAGPPGQRQNLSSSLTGMSLAPGSQIKSSKVQKPSTLQSDSRFAPDSRNGNLQSAPFQRGTIRDTLPFEEIRQYYPNGFPSDMTGEYTRLPEAVSNARSGMSEQETREANVNTSFHSGLPDLNMTTNDYIEEMTNRNNRLDNGQMSQMPQSPRQDDNALLHDLQETSEPLEDQQAVPSLSVQEINHMDITEVTAQLTGPVFGSLLRIADQRPGPNNPAMLTRFTRAAPWAIDDGPNGNRSVLGEDSGPTPRRVGRDPRYQPLP